MISVSDRERLETGLRAEWTPENLAVYADLLQDLGDPRGELIHLALRIEAGDETPELRARRDKVLETWLAGVPKSYHYLGETGFVRLPASYVGVLDTALGEFVRRVELSGSRTSLLEQIAHLGAEPRPWLDTLELVSLTRDKIEPAVAQAAVATAIERSPHLHTLVARGSWIPGWTTATQLTHLELDLGALDALARSTDTLPAVTTVDVHLPRANIRGERAELQPRSLVTQLPAIQRFDLGANETSQEVRDAMFGWLGESELVRHVQHLVVPAPRRGNNVRQLVRVAARVAGTLEIARAYAKYPFAIPDVTTPPRRPWPPLDEVEHRKLSFVVGSKSAHFTPDTLDPWLLVDTLERLANRGRVDFAPWTAFWNILGNPSWACEMPLATLLTAFESLPVHAEPAISAFTARMRELPASLRDTAIVRISHAT